MAGMRDIFDLVNRHQLYIEGVKKWYNSDFLRYLKKLAKGVRRILGGYGVKDMGELTKAQRIGVEGKLGRLHNEVIGGYGQEFYTELKKFTKTDSVLQRDAFAFLREEYDFDAPHTQVWARIADDIVPAIGLTPKDATKDFVGRSKHDLITTTRTAIVDARPVEEAITEIVGTGDKFSGGVLSRIWNSARAHVNTLIQNAASYVTETFNALISDCYQWISTIDDRTSPICRARNNVVFQAGGPRPPAHRHCRSRTIPAECGEPNMRVPGFRAWMQEQDREYLADVAGGVHNVADLLKLTDFSNKAVLAAVKPLTLDELASKKNMLTRKAA